MSSGTLIPMKGSSLRRYEQRLERSEKTTSNSPGTTGLATAAHRARDRGASGDRRCLPESGRDWSASAEGVGTATAGKTGQHGQPKPKHQHRKPFYEGKSKSRNRKTGQCEWGDHRVWRGVERLETERCEACSVHQFLRAVPGGDR